MFSPEEVANLSYSAACAAALLGGKTGGGIYTARMLERKNKELLKRNERAWGNVSDFYSLVKQHGFLPVHPSLRKCKGKKRWRSPKPLQWLCFPFVRSFPQAHHHWKCSILHTTMLLKFSLMIHYMNPFKPVTKLSHVFYTQSRDFRAKIEICKWGTT